MVLMALPRGANVGCIPHRGKPPGKPIGVASCPLAGMNFSCSQSTQNSPAGGKKSFLDLISQLTAPKGERTHRFAASLLSVAKLPALAQRNPGRPDLVARRDSCTKPSSHRPPFPTRNLKPALPTKISASTLSPPPPTPHRFSPHRRPSSSAQACFKTLSITHFLRERRQRINQEMGKARPVGFPAQPRPTARSFPISPVAGRRTRPQSRGKIRARPTPSGRFLPVSPRFAAKLLPERGAGRGRRARDSISILFSSISSDCWKMPN